MPTSSAEDCARSLLEGWIQHFEVPSNIVSDCSAQFLSTLWATLSSSLGIYLKQTTAYHPQANGMVERFHCNSRPPFKHASPLMTGLLSCQ